MTTKVSRAKSTPQKVATKIVADPEAQHRQLHFYNFVNEYVPGQQFVFMFVRSNNKESERFISRFAEMSRVEKTQHCFIAFVSDEPPQVLDLLRKTTGFLSLNVLSDVHRILFSLMQTPQIPTVIAFTASGRKYFEEHAGSIRLGAAFIKHQEPKQETRVEQQLVRSSFIGALLLHTQSHRVAQRDIDATLKKMDRVPWSAHRGSIQDCTAAYIPQIDMRARSVPQNIARCVVNNSVVLSPVNIIRTELVWDTGKNNTVEEAESESDHVQPARLHTYSRGMPVDIPDTITQYQRQRFREARDRRQFNAQLRIKQQQRSVVKEENLNIFQTEIPDSSYADDLVQKIKALSNKRTRQFFAEKQQPVPLNPIIDDIHGLARRAEKWKPALLK